jgi:hypothetical protein
MTAPDQSAVHLQPACPTCDRPIRSGEYFCADCGSALRVQWLLVPRCRCCGGLNPAGYRYCVDCGTPRRRAVDRGRDLEPTVADRPADSLVDTVVWPGAGSSHAVRTGDTMVAPICA